LNIMKLIKTAILIFILVLLAAFGAWVYYRAAVNRSSQITEAKELSIEKGMGVSEIGNQLYDQGLINSKFLFKVYLKLNNLGATLEAGEYDIPAGLDMKETVKYLQHGTFDLKITFLEGWRREQMAAYAYQIFKDNSPTGGSISNSFVNKFLKESEGAEGYLFPDTYHVEEGITAKELVSLLRDTFNEKFNEDLKTKAKQRGLSAEEVVILASIVEREVAEQGDREKVAGILIKRWREDWPLEADATIQYAVASINNPLVVESKQQSVLSDQQEWWPKKLMDADLNIESPYNTRKYKGLPPGPICNPGLDALKAVVNFEETPYWFYLSDEEGNTHFSKSLDEHNQNVIKYLSD